ncbi:CCN family member 3 [Paramormyrops kingsleyae]|uniref:CCN family member 3 n=1 Tax=Paramormyrops kingsleyae TaxID=1676925 RepID=UPI000CD5E96C|nr:protein NOV homolog [Paramormyrops kingsleyae]
MMYLVGKFFSFFVFFVSAQLPSQTWAQQCPSRCRCAAEPPACAPGVRLVLDDCACCLACARQRGEQCSESSPCDARRGLRCDYAANVRRRSGVCMAREGKVCRLDDAVYRDGETFFPSCKYQCVCQDGNIGCVPRCDLDVMLPGPDCPSPRKVQVPGQCCEQWVCVPPSEPPSEASLLGGFAMAAYRQEETLGFDPSLNCIEQTSVWSACSRTCGLGVSTRVTTRNRRCEMVKQSRLCLVRPCGPKQRVATTMEKGDECQKTKRTPKPTHFNFKNCTSMQEYKPLYCGSCSDDRCCTPHSTRTVQVTFRCPGGRSLKKLVMFINTCVCHSYCPLEDAPYHLPNHSRSIPRR